MKTPDPIKTAKAEIRDLKREMKSRGVRVVSCFNGGLTPDESRYNSELFKLKTQLSLLSK